MNNNLSKELFQMAKLAGMSGQMNKYPLHLKELILKESVLLLNDNMPIYDKPSEYTQYMLQKAREENFFQYVSQSYNLDEDTAETIFLSPLNIYKTLIALEYIQPYQNPI